jgi:hypothetical protein
MYSIASTTQGAVLHVETLQSKAWTALTQNLSLGIPLLKLCTKGKILGLYNNEGMFYLEKSRPLMTETGNERVDGPYIKYGPKKKSIQFSLDLTPYNPKMPLTILKVAGSKNKFQIFEGEQLKIKLKASGEKE